MQKEQSIDPDVTYLRRLEREIEATERYLLDADKAIARLEQQLQLSTQDGERSQMEHTIALQNAYEKLPWTPDKNEVLGTAIASVEIARMGKQQKNTISMLRRHAQEKREEIADLDELASEYKQIVPILLEQDVELKRVQELLDARQKTMELTPESVLQDLAANKKQSQYNLKELQRGLAKVLRKYIAVSDHRKGNTLHQTALRERMVDAQRLVRNLLAHVPTDSWVVIENPTETEESLITTWIINDILVVHDQTIPSHYYRIKFRAYGV